MSSLFFILLCTIGALIIHLWFYSDFFAFYLKCFKKILPTKFYSWLLVDEYLKTPDTDSYIEYLFIKRYPFAKFKTQFFLKLFSCVTCFTVWVSIVLSLIYGNLLYVGLFFFVLRILDFILRYVLKKAI